MNIISIKKITLCDIYVVLFALYEYAAVYINTSIASLGTYFPMMFIGIFSLYQVALNKKKHGYIKVLMVFIVFLSIYGVIHWLGGETLVGRIKPTSFLFGNFMSLAPVLVFYLGTLKGKVDEKRMLIYLIVFVILSILRYRYNYVKHDMELEEGFSNVGFTNNAAYFFVSLLPFVFIFDKKPIVQYGILLLCVYFVMNGLKRGAIFTTIAFFVVFVLYTLKKEGFKRSKTKHFLSIIFLFLSFYAVYYLIQNFWLNNDFFYYRLYNTEEGNMSGRDYIYSVLWNHFLNDDNLFHLIFGLGAEGTIRVVGIHAHNDWLELLIDCGIVGVVIYLSYFVMFVKECVRYKNINPEVYVVISCGVILFMESLFSMSYMNMYLGISVALGYGLATCQQKNKYSLQ